MLHCSSELFDSCISDGGVEDLKDSNFFAEVTGGQSLVHPNAVFQVNCIHTGCKASDCKLLVRHIVVSVVDCMHSLWMLPLSYSCTLGWSCRSAHCGEVVRLPAIVVSLILSRASLSNVDSTAFAAFSVVETPPGLGSRSVRSSHRGRCVHLACCWLSLSSATNIVYIAA